MSVIASTSGSSILANIFFGQMECGAVTDTKAKIFIDAPTNKVKVSTKTPHRVKVPMKTPQSKTV